MPRCQISEISAAAKAVVACMSLPEHVRSLAATIEKMAIRAAAETRPDPAVIHTLEQASGILGRWIADYDFDGNGVKRPSGSTVRQPSGAAANACSPQVPSL